jgi:ubiquinone/menaquinone biosynthesis C-methylase UbiE
MREARSSQYYRDYPITSPAHMVVTRAGRQIQAFASRYLTGRLLDIGCGEKKKQFLVGESVTQYVGLDHRDSLHDLNNVDIVGTAYEIPAPDASFDSVLCTAVLEHLEEPLDALKESFRILKSGGYALYTVPLFWHLHEEPRDFYRYTRYGLEHLFHKAGFVVVETIPLSGFWITFGSEWNYYLQSVLKHFSKPFIAVNNILFPFLDGVDRKLHRSSTRWTWLYLVLVKKND